MAQPHAMPSLRVRPPQASDGTPVWNLVKAAGGLDVNSAYAYILLCDRFAETCAVAEEVDGELVGFVSAFVQPGRSDTLFVWQIAVHPSMRGRGVGSHLLDALLSRRECSGVRYVEATIAPGNAASQGLFHSLAERRGSVLKADSGLGYASELFPAGTTHEDEWLYRIGFLRPSNPTPRR